MNNKSLKRIEEVIIPSGRWDALEIIEDILYLDFTGVELGNPKYDDLTLSIRFAGNVIISLFYKNIWDIDFSAHYNPKNPQLYESFSLKVKEIKFLDFGYLNQIFEKYDKHKTLSMNKDLSAFNIQNDFFVAFETSNIAVIAAANEMNFFTKEEKLNDDILKDLSNKWMLYCLKYHLKRNLIKDSMCEKYEFK